MGENEDQGPAGEPELGAVRLGQLLNSGECSVKKKDLAARLGMTAEWLSKHINQSGGAKGKRMPIENLMAASYVLSKRRSAFDEQFAGTYEYASYLALPPPIRLIVDRIRELNVGRVDRGERLITRETIGPIMMESGGWWSSSEWGGLLEDKLRLPDGAPARRALAEMLGLPYADLVYDDETGPYDVIPDDVHWLVIDHLVLEKLKAPTGIEGDALDKDALVRFARRQFVRVVGEDAWKAIPQEVRNGLLTAALPWVRRWRYIEAARKRPGGSTEIGAAKDILSLVAAHLPHISEPLVSSAKGLHQRALASKGSFVKHHAAALGVSPQDLALLLLGIAAFPHRPEAAKKLQHRRAKAPTKGGK